VRGNFSGMSDKDVVIETLRQMPEAATLEQISEEIAILAAIRKGEAAADAGRVTPHEEVRQKIASWISK
jgi:predicted transcriptional regulator